jgi:hypothetical protein
MALELSWQVLRTAVDNEADHMAIQRAARHADRTHPDDAYRHKSAEWYAAAINHYLAR